MDSVWTIVIIVAKNKIKEYQRLKETIDNQIENRPVKVVVVFDNLDGAIGFKRQVALDFIDTDYVSFVDGEDYVPGMYVDCILQEIHHDPCAIGFRGLIGSQSLVVMEFVNKHGLAYSNKPSKYDGSLIYTRPIGHINPIKTAIAMRIGYQDLDFGEDIDYATRLSQSGLIKNPAFINEFLYFYNSRKI